MDTKQLMRKTEDELEQLKMIMTCRGNWTAVEAIANVQEYGHKNVRVYKGRKVPVGTEGECFWIGSTCHSRYGDPWGIYTSWRCGIKDNDGNVYWTSLDNVEVITERINMKTRDARIYQNGEDKWVLELLIDGDWCFSKSWGIRNVGTDTLTGEPIDFVNDTVLTEIAMLQNIGYNVRVGR